MDCWNNVTQVNGEISYYPATATSGNSVASWVGIGNSILLQDGEYNTNLFWEIVGGPATTIDPKTGKDAPVVPNGNYNIPSGADALSDVHYWTAVAGVSDYLSFQVWVNGVGQLRPNHTAMVLGVGIDAVSNDQAEWIDERPSGGLSDFGLRLWFNATFTGDGGPGRPVAEPGEQQVFMTSNGLTPPSDTDDCARYSHVLAYPDMPNGSTFTDIWCRAT